VRQLAVLVAAIVLGGCPKPAARPVLDGTWPATAADYSATSATWTRGAEIEDSYQLVARVHATLLSPAWRAAMIERRVRVGKLGDDGRAELEAAQRAADEAAWEVEIVMSTWDRRENDLDRGERSVWRLVLVDADGHDVSPIEIVRDKRPDDMIRAEFPSFDDFSRAYIARFPRTARILAPGTTRVGMRMSSARGGLELFWEQ
jgi:hypothetical protein